MKKKFFAVAVIVFLILLSLTALLVFPKKSETISSDQQHVIDLMGYPKQFVITYVESGSEDNPQLTRNEIWIYPEDGLKVTFLGGNLIYSDEYKKSADIIATKFKPEDFEFDQTYSQIANIIGKDSLYEVDDLPGITDKEIKVYTNGEVMFLMENGYLTYLQTFSYAAEENEK